MISLPVYNKQDERFREFGTARMPLRPSALGKLVACPMSVFLSYSPGNDLGGTAAQTGNLVHAAVAEYHRKVGDERAGVEALEAARAAFPGGDPVRARRIYAAYSADPRNKSATVVWVEEPVQLVIEATPDDPTGEPIVVDGTLDQVRRDGSELSVWDVKTGDASTADETLDEYLLQQAGYVLAARETLHADVVPGGVIYTPGYEKARGRRFLPLKLSVDQCKMLMVSVAYAVSRVRRGLPAFQPSKGACKYCPVRPYTHCFPMFRGAYA